MKVHGADNATNTSTAASSNQTEQTSTVDPEQVSENNVMIGEAKGK